MKQGHLFFVDYQPFLPLDTIQNICKFVSLARVQIMIECNLDRTKFDSFSYVQFFRW